MVSQQPQSSDAISSEEASEVDYGTSAHARQAETPIADENEPPGNDAADSVTGAVTNIPHTCYLACYCLARFSLSCTCMLRIQQLLPMPVLHLFLAHLQMMRVPCNVLKSFNRCCFERRPQVGPITSIHQYPPARSRCGTHAVKLKAVLPQVSLLPQPECLAVGMYPVHLWRQLNPYLVSGHHQLALSSTRGLLRTPHPPEPLLTATQRASYHQRFGALLL